MKASHISYSSLSIVFYGYLVCFVFQVNKNKPNQKHVFIKGAMRVTVNFLFKPSYQYSQTDRIFSFLTIPVAFASFNTLFGFSLVIVPFLALSFLTLTFWPIFPFLFCLISFVFRKQGCLDLHPFSPAFSLSLSPPVAPFSSSPTHFFTFPLTITHPNSPTFPLFPSTPIPRVFFLLHFLQDSFEPFHSPAVVFSVTPTRAGLTESEDLGSISGH